MVTGKLAQPFHNNSLSQGEIWLKPVHSRSGLRPKKKKLFQKNNPDYGTDM